jgi:hypothetical protein
MKTNTIFVVELPVNRFGHRQLPGPVIIEVERRPDDNHLHVISPNERRFSYLALPITGFDFIQVPEQTPGYLDLDEYARLLEANQGAEIIGKGCTMQPWQVLAARALANGIHPNDIPELKLLST